MIPAFKSAAEDLLNNSGLSVVDLLAKALAKAVVSQSSSSFSPFVFFLLFFKVSNHLRFMIECVGLYRDQEKISINFYGELCYITS